MNPEQWLTEILERLEQSRDLIGAAWGECEALRCPGLLDAEAFLVRAQLILELELLRAGRATRLHPAPAPGYDSTGEGEGQ